MHNLAGRHFCADEAYRPGPGPAEATSVTMSPMRSTGEGWP